MTPVVALSGWSMPATVFEPLQTYCDMTLSGLPGCVAWPGISSEADVCWSSLIEGLDRILPEGPVTLAGWSLGGALAIHYAAARPERIKQLVLMGCNPCFVASDDWPCGMSPIVFKQFIAGMQNEPQATLKKFLFLCVQGAQDTRLTLKELRQLIVSEKPCVEALFLPLLTLLRDDLRLVLDEVMCPVTHLLAENDALVPGALAEVLSHRYPSHRIEIIEGGHTFFREQPDVVAQRLIESSEPA